MTMGPEGSGHDETKPYSWETPPPPPLVPYAAASPNPAYPPHPTYPPHGGTPYGSALWQAPVYSDKSKTTAGLLQLLLPFVCICGVGRLYSGHLAIGLVQLLGYFLGLLLLTVFIGIFIFPPIWIWTVIDGIVILSSQSRDGEGRLLR